MKFKEQFPSLSIYNMGELEGCYDDYCDPKQVQEHCLDKQKVREAIDECWRVLVDNECCVNALIKVKKDLKKELGLKW